METKKEFRIFTIMEYDKEERYLQKRHSEGWRFVKASGYGIYLFEKCEPEGVVYQLDYNREGISDRGEYIQMFEDCGWEHVAEYEGYSYFRKPVAAMTADEEIFNDDSSKLDMIQRIFKGKIIPLFIAFALYLLAAFVLPAFFEGPVITLLLLNIRILLLVYILVAIHFFVKYLAYQKRIKK